MIVPLDT